MTSSIDSITEQAKQDFNARPAQQPQETVVRPPKYVPTYLRFADGHVTCIF